MRSPIAAVIMGISGCGKSLIGAQVASKLEVSFLEGDDFHGPENIAKMADAKPLNDADRQPWLERVAAAIAAETQNNDMTVASCSALRKSYRDVLRAKAGARLLFVHLDVGYAVATRRIASRSGHYMPASLLDSQVCLLEAPSTDEWCLLVDAIKSPQTSPTTSLATSFNFAVWV
jgi:gluconokinase